MSLKKVGRILVIITLLLVYLTPYNSSKAQSDILRAIERAYEYFASLPGPYMIQTTMTQEREVAFLRSVFIGVALSFCLENEEIIPIVKEKERKGKILLEKIINLTFKERYRAEKGWRSEKSGALEDAYWTAYTALLLSLIHI